MKALCLATVVIAWLAQAAHGQPSPPSAPPSDWQGGYLGAKDAKRKVAVVFIHGVLGNYLTSWTNKNGTYWPQLVAKDSVFKDANVYVYRYQSPKLETAQNIEELATRLGDFLNKDGVIRDHDRIVFVCHSMGGLIARAFLVQSRLSAKKVPLIYFYGTPTAGANAAAIGYLAGRNPQFENMRPFVPGGYVESLAKKWLATSEDAATGYPRRIWSFCAYEKKEYLGKIVVEQLSATYLCNATPRAIVEDHIDMVKPESPTSDAHVYLARAYQVATSPSGETLLAAMNAPTDKAGTVYLPGLQTGKLDKFRYRTTSIDAGIEKVECNETRQGERTVAVKNYKAESLVAAVASVEAMQGLSNSTVAVSAWNKDQIGFKYHVQGNMTPVGDCPSRGAALLKIKTLLIEQE
jgi:pimeloyl-ACP methyl ester carboxylesterase